MLVNQFMHFFLVMFKQNPGLSFYFLRDPNLPSLLLISAQFRRHLFLSKEKCDILVAYAAMDGPITYSLRGAIFQSVCSCRDENDRELLRKPSNHFLFHISTRKTETEQGMPVGKNQTTGNSEYQERRSDTRRLGTRR